MHFLLRASSLLKNYYILRNIIQLIPFPFEGIYGFQYLRVKEVASPPTVTLFLFIFQYKYQQKLSYIKDKVTNEIS